MKDRSAKPRGLKEPFRKWIYNSLLIREGYFLLINIIEGYRHSYPQVDSQLNIYYMDIAEKVDSYIKELEQDFPGMIASFYYLPFENLFTAEEELKNQDIWTSKDGIDWNSLRKNLYNCFGKLESYLHKTIHKRLKDVNPDRPDLYIQISTYLRETYPNGLILAPVSLNQSEFFEREPRGESQIYLSNQAPDWEEDFREESGLFIFGTYGSLSFKSEKRTSLFGCLFKRKGRWVTNKEIRKETGLNQKYIGSTISQMESSFNKDIKKYISIPAPKNDRSLASPGYGGYRIKFYPRGDAYKDSLKVNLSIKDENLASKQPFS